jgi:hypothetical protein
MAVAGSKPALTTFLFRSVFPTKNEEIMSHHHAAPAVPVQDSHAETFIDLKGKTLKIKNGEMEFNVSGGDNVLGLWMNGKDPLSGVAIYLQRNEKGLQPVIGLRNGTGVLAAAISADEFNEGYLQLRTKSGEVLCISATVLGQALGLVPKTVEDTPAQPA